MQMPTEFFLLAPLSREYVCLHGFPLLHTADAPPPAPRLELLYSADERANPWEYLTVIVGTVPSALVFIGIFFICFKHQHPHGFIPPPLRLHGCSSRMGLRDGRLSSPCYPSIWTGRMRSSFSCVAIIGSLPPLHGHEGRGDAIYAPDVPGETGLKLLTVDVPDPYHRRWFHASLSLAPVRPPTCVYGWGTSVD